MNNILSLESLGSVLAGAGLAKLDSDTSLALTLIGAGVLLHVLKAVLNRFGVPISANKHK